MASVSDKIVSATSTSISVKPSLVPRRANNFDANMDQHAENA